MKYTLSDVQTIINRGFETNISEEIPENLRRLMKNAGFNYEVYMPSFVEKKHTNIGNNTISNNHREERREERREAWIAQCKKGALHMDKTKMEEIINVVRLNLNKLTVKTWNNIIDKVKVQLNEIDDDDTDTQCKITDIIYTILSSNLFNSLVYSKMYVHLTHNYKWINNTFETQYEHHINEFDELKYVSPNDDYDAFCEINKQNEKRKAVSAFLANMTELKHISAVKLYRTIIKLMEKVVSLSTQQSQSDIVDVLSDNIILMHTKDVLHLLHENTENANLEELVVTCEGFENKNVLEHITRFATSKLKTYPSISSKTKFAYMKMIGR